MSLIEMSFSGSVLILAVTVIRALALNRLPKGVFLVLWGIAVLRLLAPFSIPSPLSVYSLAETPAAEVVETVVTDRMRPQQTEEQAISTVPAVTVSPSPADGGSGESVPVWGIIWMTGAFACAAFFTVSYVRCRRKFRNTLPEEDKTVEEWLAERRLRRPVAVRRCEAVSAPLTYGVFRPVILLPVSMPDRERMAYVLEHELVHIQRFDVLSKLALTAAVCVHWFNPLSWVMYVLANRDIELSCDETVVRRFGLGNRSAYAMTLIHMEETRSGLPPLASGFSKNAIEERITAIMKLKKTSVLAVLLAMVLVCGVSVGFATSPAESAGLRGYLKSIPGMDFTKEETRRLLSLWFDGYEDMTVAAYQQKMWTEQDDWETMRLIERYSQEAWQTYCSIINDEKANKARDAFQDYFYNVYEPLTAETWQSRSFSRSATADGWRDYRLSDDDSPALNALLEYTFVLNIMDAEKLTVGEYEKAFQDVKTAMTALLWERTAEELKDDAYMRTFLDREIAALEGRLGTDSLRIEISYGFIPIETVDEALHAEVSQQVSQNWDELLAPYTPFGLTYEFSDPDHDGNGLTMYYQGREVRGIMDEEKNIWITEHTGNSSFSSDAIELYTVYEEGNLTGLRPASAAEQAGWDLERQRKNDTTFLPGGQLVLREEEEREFQRGTAEDYAAFLELMEWDPGDGLPAHASRPYLDYQDMSLKEFNRRLLDWGNEHPDAYDRIMCDAAWDDFAVELTEEEKRFVSLTCQLSGTENGMYVRSVYLGRTEEDPGFSENLPEFQQEENGITVAWCDLFYQCSYHISDKSAVKVRERDQCVSGMVESVRRFWREAGIDELLRMTEDEVAEVLNRLAAENSSEQITIMPFTLTGIHFEVMDERGHD